VNLWMALLGAHPHAVLEQVLRRHDGLDLFLPAVASMYMCTDVPQRYGAWATIFMLELEHELFLTSPAVGRLMASMHIFHKRKATPAYESKPVCPDH